MKFNLLAVSILLLLTLAVIEPQFIAVSDSAGTRNVVEVLASYRDKDDVKSATSVGCYIEREFSLFNMVLMVCPINALEDLKLEGLNIVPNFEIKIETVFSNFKPFNPSALQQGLNVSTPMYWSWAISRVSADIVWNYLGEYGSDTVIAVLDTGIDPTHPLLAGKVVAWAEFDAKGKPVCSKPHDTYGHGTWVASIAAGGDGRRYIFGVAPNAKIMAALVLPYGSGTAAQVLAGLEWVLQPYDPCTNNKINVKPNVVSMSFGSTGNYSNVFLPAIKKLIENGIVAVAAIGNSGPYSSANPGNIWGVIGVGATDYDNDLASFSSYEYVEWPNPPSDWPFKGGYPKTYRKPDVVAPGVDVPGAFPGELLAIASGTSASTPIVAGIAAIVSAKLKAQGLDGVKLVEKVYDIITSTATPLMGTGFGYGLVNSYLAVASAKNINIELIDLDLYPSTTRPLSNITLNIRGIDLGTSVDVYISGAKVFSGILRSRLLTVPIPLTHGGGNTVTVVSKNGLIYGKTLVRVTPSIYSEKTCFWSRVCKVLVSGVGIGDMLAVYFGSNIVTLYTSNLRGSFNASFITPIVEEGMYTVTVIDFSRPDIVLQAQVYVNPIQLYTPSIVNNTYIIVKNQTYVTLVNNTYALPIYVGVKEYYIANTIDFIDLYIYRGSVEDISIDRDVYSLVDIKVINITKVDNYLYRLWLKIGIPKVDELYAKINLTIKFDNTVFPYMLSIRILKQDPNKMTESKVAQLSSFVNENADLLNKLREEVNSLRGNLSNAINSINDLGNTVNSLEQKVKNNVDILNKNIESLSNRIASIEHLLFIVTILSVVAVVISSVIVIKIVRRGA